MNSFGDTNQTKQYVLETITIHEVNPMTLLLKSCGKSWPIEIDSLVGGDWNMFFFNIGVMSSSQLAKSIIFSEGLAATTKQSEKTMKNPPFLMGKAAYFDWAMFLLTMRMYPLNILEPDYPLVI